MPDNIEAMMQKLNDALAAGIITKEDYERLMIQISAQGDAQTDAPEPPVTETVSEATPEVTPDVTHEVTPEEPAAAADPQDDGIVYFGANDNVQTRSSDEPGQAFAEQVKVETVVNEPAGKLSRKEKKRAKKQAKLQGKKGKKKWYIIGGIVLLLVLFGAIGSCGGDGPSETYDWPTDSKVAKMLPVPDGTVTYISVDEEDGYLNADVTMADTGACKAYIEACGEKGFTVDKDSSQSGNDYSYTAKNEDGWEVHVYNFEEDLGITLKSPEYLKAMESDEDEDTDEDIEEEETTEEGTADESEDSDSVFSPQDVSDETIESIETYGDYLIMYEKITDDYLANYEEVVKGTVLYDEATFEEMKDEYDKAFEEQQKEYGAMKNKKIIGKDDLVTYLKDYRDGLKEYVDTLSESL